MSKEAIVVELNSAENVGIEAKDIKPKRVVALAAGLHAGLIELRSGDHFNVRLLSGQRIDATLSGHCRRSLMDECLRDRRMVLLSQGEDGPEIIGAVQTQPSAATVDRQQQIEMRGERLELDAAKQISLRVGDTTLELRRDGSVRLAGNRLTMDIAALVKVLSAKMELP